MENTIDKSAIAEFNNLLSLYELSNTASRFEEFLKLRKSDDRFRREIFSEYYNTPDELITTLQALTPAERKIPCKQKNINPYIFRTLFDYNRYRECFLIHRYLSRTFDFHDKKLLDFGCLVADYGFYFGMLGMNVTLCDLPEHVDFADFRLGRANINRTKIYAPSDYMATTRGQDLAIFGEVLEHLKDPYQLLKSCVDNNVKYIFTSCYPYGDEAYFNLPGHTIEAKQQSPLCIDMLRASYIEVNLGHKFTMWVRNEMKDRLHCII